MLLKKEPERVLYLAVPNKLRDLLLLESDFRYVLRELQVRLIFFAIATEKEQRIKRNYSGFTVKEAMQLIPAGQFLPWQLNVPSRPPSD